MEKYLLEDYGVYEDEKYLVNEESIEDYFQDNYYDLFDCGQGYYQDEATVICKIKDKFFEVTLIAEIGSSKQDRGDRLYWIEYIRSITYREIEKPLPKKRTKVNYELNLTVDEKVFLEKFLEENDLHFINS